MNLIKIKKIIKFIKFLTPAEYCIAGGFLLLDLHRLPCVLQEKKLDMIYCVYVEKHNIMQCVTWKAGITISMISIRKNLHPLCLKLPVPWQACHLFLPGAHLCVRHIPDHDFLHHFQRGHHFNATSLENNVNFNVRILGVTSYQHYHHYLALLL